MLTLLCSPIVVLSSFFVVLLMPALLALLSQGRFHNFLLVWDVVWASAVRVPPLPTGTGIRSKAAVGGTASATSASTYMWDQDSAAPAVAATRISALSPFPGPCVAFQGKQGKLACGFGVGGVNRNLVLV